MRLLVLICLLFLICSPMTTLAYTYKNRQFDASNHKVKLVIPSHTKFHIRENLHDVYVVDFRSDPTIHSFQEYIIAIVPIDEKHYPNYKKYPSDQYLKESLNFRIKTMLSSEKASRLQTINCKSIYVGKTKAAQCLASINNPSTILVGTLMREGDNALHVYGLQPREKGFNFKTYNQLLKSIKVKR